MTPVAGSPSVRPRATTALYQTAARLWLTSAGLALLLPDDIRFGVWLPLHLALAGAVSVAISGAMQNFASTLTATAQPSPARTYAQFTLVNAGVGLVAIGRPAGVEALVAAGGASFALGILVLGDFLRSARRRSLHLRHRVPLAMYAFAVASVLVGATFGLLMGSGVAGGAYAGLRRGHAALNVLGWASATIVGTLVTLLPTVLRVRMPVWQGRWTAGAFAAGVALVATGLAIDATAVAAIGGAVLVIAVGGVAWLVTRVVRSPRRWPMPVTAGHFLAAVAWFCVGTVGLAVALLRGGAGFDGFREPFLVIFVGGWILQTLLGAWLYLLPMARPAHPDERRRSLVATELGGRVQVVALNAGLVLLALRAWELVPGAVGPYGAGLAIGAAAVALAKAWAYPLLGRFVGMEGRGVGVWGGRGMAG